MLTQETGTTIEGNASPRLQKPAKTGLIREDMAMRPGKAGVDKALLTMGANTATDVAMDVVTNAMGADKIFAEADGTNVDG